MTQEERSIQTDRMRYTQDTMSANLVLVAIVMDALYFVSIYQSDVSTWYYNWVLGASIICNLLFLLTAFLASQGVKNRKSGYGLTLLVLGIMQIVRIFYLPAKAHDAVLEIGQDQLQVMSDGQHTYVVACLIVSAVCCVAAAVTNYINNKQLAEHMRQLQNKAA